MTDQQKDILIAKMLDAPHTLSDNELDMILADEELRDIYNMSADLASACADSIEVDSVKEWNRFRSLIAPKPRRMRWLPRAVAAAAVAVMVVGVAVRFGPVDEETVTEPIPPIAMEEVIVKREGPAPGHSVQSDMAESKVEAPAVKKPRKRKADRKVEEIDVDEYIRIKQARIDNEIALQTAEYMEEEYKSICNDVDIPDVEERTLMASMRIVTMQ